MLRWPEAVYDYILDHTRINDPLLSEKDANAQLLSEWLASPEAAHFAVDVG